MTIEELQSEKAVLKEKIQKAVNEFHEATGLQVSGEFMVEKTSIHDIMGVVMGTHTVAEVTINPIEI